MCTIPTGLAYGDGVSNIRLVNQYIVFCVEVLVIQLLLWFGARLAVHHQVARWIHLFSMRFSDIDALLAGLMFSIFRLCVSLT
jgi:hypothetical protein